MAYIAFMECWQMTATFIAGIMVATQSTISDSLFHATGNVAFTGWTTLLVLRCCLAVNRFAVITDFVPIRLRHHRYFHRVLMTLPMIVLCGIIALCVVYKHPFVMIIDLGGWNFIESTPCRPVESFFSNGMSLCAFFLYFTTVLYIIKMKQRTQVKANLGEIKILASSALAFSYEMFMIFLFHCIFPFIDLPSWPIGIIGIMWSFLPAFNGIVLLAINRNFRIRFFANRLCRANAPVIQVLPAPNTSGANLKSDSRVRTITQ
uniref:G_PROTEIN_RECEP_F1_2 domain-containing protein n=1 Tax=Steinernema glaseri TaxID=37863 RepID=A0A1I7Z6D2_9BILA